MCGRCAELESEIRELRRDLGYESDLRAVQKVKEALGIEPGPARMLVALYRRKGEGTRFEALYNALGSEALSIKNLVRVYAHRLNSRAGEDLIQNVWGFGYRLTPHGLATVRAALGAAA